MRIKNIFLFFVVSSIYCAPSFLGSGSGKEDLVGKSYIEAINLFVIEWNGRLIGDYVVTDEKTGSKFLNEDVLLENQRAIRYMKENFGKNLARISFIAEFNRIHIVALDEKFNILGHVINNSDAFFIPDSGPLSKSE